MKTITRAGMRLALRITLTSLALACFTIPHASPATAGEAFTRWHWCTNEDRLALAGYDPVAYWNAESATPGSAEFEAKHHGIRYHFANDENRAAFLAEPERYLPAFGGWCAFALTLEVATAGRGPLRLAPDPEVFLLQDGKLFLFSHGPGWNGRARWLQGDTEARLRKANAFWASRETLAASVGAKPEGMHRNAPLETVQFDFIIGEWKSQYKVRVSPNQEGYSPTIQGTWKARYGWDGFAIYDDWSQLGGPPGNSGPAIRSFDPASGKWVMHYIPINAPLSAVWAMEGTFDENGELHASMRASDPSGEFLQRVHFIDISEDHFSWRSDRSYDNGKTWIINWGMGENYRVTGNARGS